MKWYNYIVILGIFLLGMGIWAVFDLIRYIDWYETNYSKSYRIPGYDFKFLISIFLSSLVLILIGAVIDKVLKRLE